MSYNGFKIRSVEEMDGVDLVKVMQMKIAEMDVIGIQGKEED